MWNNFSGLDTSTWKDLPPMLHPVLDILVGGKVSWLLNFVINNNLYWPSAFTLFFITQYLLIVLSNLTCVIWSQSHIRKRVSSSLLGEWTACTPGEHLVYSRCFTWNISISFLLTILWGLYCYPHPLNEEMGLREGRQLDQGDSVTEKWSLVIKLQARIPQ